MLLNDIYPPNELFIKFCHQFGILLVEDIKDWHINTFQVINKISEEDINELKRLYKNSFSENKIELIQNKEIKKNKIDILYNCCRILDDDVIGNNNHIKMLNNYVSNINNELNSNDSNFTEIDFKYEINNYIKNAEQNGLFEYLCNNIALLGPDLIKDLINNTERAINNCLAFNYSIKEEEIEDKLRIKIKEIIKNINSNNLSARLKFLISESLIYKKIYQSTIKTLKDLIEFDLRQFDQSELELLIVVLKKFIKDLKKDLMDVFYESLLRRNAANDIHEISLKYIQILACRANDNTLEATGNLFNITRERVRQIEYKYEIKFRRFIRNSDFNNILKAFSMNENYITNFELEEIFKENSNIIIHYLKRITDKYYEDANLFLLNDKNWIEIIEKYVCEIPNVIYKVDMNKHCDIVKVLLNQEHIDISENLIYKIMTRYYLLNGTIYTRTRLSQIEKYKMIMEKHYCDGINIYDANEMNGFRHYYDAMFQDDKMPDNDRALYGRLSDACINIGRGKYGLKKENYISDTLLTSIYEYIMSSNYDVLPTSSIYGEFEDELLDEGVSNRYYLHGILRQFFGSKLFFRRDYISKNIESFNFYEVLCNFIKSKKKEVSKREIKDAFPDITEITLYVASLNENILHLHNSYIHIDYLDIDEGDMNFIDKTIKELLLKKNIIHIGELYNVLAIRLSNFLEEWDIEDNFKLYPIVRYLLEYKYSFKGFSIALQGYDIPNREEVFKNYIYESDLHNIFDIKDFAKESNIQIPSIIDKINSLNDDYFLKNKDEIIKIDLIGINQYNISEIERYLILAMSGKGFIIPKEINYKYLPTINIPWNEWLLYSIINKWGKDTNVMLTNNQLRFALPIFMSIDKGVNSFESFIKYIKERNNYNDAQTTMYLLSKDIIK